MICSLVIPVYKNEDNIPDLLNALNLIANDLEGRLEVVFVIDGSPDQCADILRSLLSKQSFVSRLIVLSRNFGSFAAIRVGLQQATGDYFAVMAADLQEPPELVKTFFQRLESKQVDVVVGVRKGREDELVSRFSSNLFWTLYRKFVVPQMPVGGVDMFGCNKAFRDCLLSCEEANTSLIALIFWMGFRREQVSYSRQKRKHGVSAWTIGKKVNYLMDSIFSFSDLPVRLLLLLGTLGITVSLILGFVVFFCHFLGFLTVPGYTATMLVMLFFGGINIFGLGLVGSYAWRCYENTKRRPLAIILHEQCFSMNSPSVT